MRSSVNVQNVAVHLQTFTTAKSATLRFGEQRYEFPKVSLRHLTERKYIYTYLFIKKEVLLAVVACQTLAASMSCQMKQVQVPQDTSA